MFTFFHKKKKYRDPDLERILKERQQAIKNLEILAQRLQEVQR